MAHFEKGAGLLKQQFVSQLCSHEPENQCKFWPEDSTADNLRVRVPCAMMRP